MTAPRTGQAAWGAVVVAVVTTAVFAQTLGFPFVWDDNVYVVSNPHLRSVRYVGEYFTANFCAGAAKECAFYRPLVALSHLGDYLLWGPAPHGHHLTSLLVHLAVVLVFYVVTLQLFGSPRAAVIAALFFAVHPLRVESVAFVAARTDPPAALWTLLALWAFARARAQRGTRATVAWAASLFAYGAALLTKEIALTLPALLVLYDGLVARPWKSLHDASRRVRLVVPYAGVAALYFVARRAALGYGTTGDLKLAELPDRLLGAPALVWDYLRLQVVPHPLAIFHGRPSLFGSRTVAIAWGLVVVSGALAVLVRARRWSPGVTFGGLWFIIGLLPVLNLVPIPWPTVVERFSYLPSLGFALAVGLAADHALTIATPPRRRLLTAVGVGALAVLVVLSTARTRVWGDELLLWQDTAAKSPEFPLAYMNLGILYQERGDLARAAAAYQESLEINPQNAKIHHNLATLYQDTGRLDDALGEYRRLIELGEATPQAYFNMGMIYEEKDDPAQAIASYREAIRRNPDYAKAHLRLGGALVDTGRPDDAVTAFREATRIDPRSEIAHLALANLLDDLGRPQEAADTYARYLAIASPTTRQSPAYREAQARLDTLRHSNTR